MTAVTHRLSWIPELTQPILKRNRVLELSHCVLTACSYQLMYFLINPKYVNYTERAIYWLDISHHLHLHILTKHGPGPLGSLWSGQLLASSDIEDDLSSNQNSCRVKLRRLQLLKDILKKFGIIIILSLFGFRVYGLICRLYWQTLWWN